MIATQEHSATFDCFGSRCSVYAGGEGAAGAVARAERALRRWHAQFTRFEAGSELSRLNADPRDEIPVSPVMARFVHALVGAAALTGGVVDGTLLGELERAGYDRDLDPDSSLPLEISLALALPPRRPARPSSHSRWREITLGPDGRTVRRPPGVLLDSGGLAKGLFADLLAAELAGYESFAVDCAGDLRVGGAERAVYVAGPFDDRVLHTFELGEGGIATSGVGRRSWLDRHGEPAHHLLDPSTGRPAFTGVVQATALAPTALEAEVRAKAAVLSGRAQARDWLPHGGVIVFDDGAYEVV